LHQRGTPSNTEGPGPFQVGLCEGNCVNVLGNYSERTTIAIASEILDGFLRKLYEVLITNAVTFSTLLSTLKSSSMWGDSASWRDCKDDAAAEKIGELENNNDL